MNTYGSWPPSNHRRVLRSYHFCEQALITRSPVLADQGARQVVLAAGRMRETSKDSVSPMLTMPISNCHRHRHEGGCLSVLLLLMNGLISRRVFIDETGDYLGRLPCLTSTNFIHDETVQNAAPNSSVVAICSNFASISGND